ncbi:hypothetical protein [Sphingobacterium hotanense]|uniref:Uncharacterized protein n=1 Tax=Sphingobacterium hotanense TaxID=649196 RepID=A0ABT7NME4_9SPHI|nr:hypothetical protein [Sphingobacterium hotanense]MDM1048286.1 hypothetical protein [Sphingobacterium hotanense]
MTVPTQNTDERLLELIHQNQTNALIDGGEQTRTYMQYLKDMEESKAVFNSSAYLAEKAIADSLMAEA